MTTVVGIDAGGSKTRLIAQDDQGNTIANVVGAAANWRTTLTKDWEERLTGLGLSGLEAKAVVVCCAGILTSKDRSEAEAIVCRCAPRALVKVVPDFYAPLALEDSGTVVVVVGTGSVIARQWKGSVLKRGGNGFLLGDKGSLVQFGLTYVRELLDKDLGFRGLSPPELVAWLYEPLSEAPRKLAEIGVFAVQGADDHALRLMAAKVFPPLAEKIRDLAEVEAVALTGGLWRLSPLLVDLFCSSMDLPDARCWLQQEEPAMGAVKLAWLLLNEYGSPKSPLLQS